MAYLQRERDSESESDTYSKDENPAGRRGAKSRLSRNGWILAKSGQVALPRWS